MEKVQSLLSNVDFVHAETGTSSGQIMRISMVADAGFPPFVAIPASYFIQNKKFPAYSENAWVSGTDCFKKPGASVFFLCHRWLKPDHPDDDAHSKAKAIAEFAQFYRTHREFQSDPNGIYFWCDYSCIDPSRREESIRALPLYIACCKLVLCYKSPDFSSRAWCQIELSIASSVSRYGSTPWVIDGSFKSLEEGNGDFKVSSPTRLMEDPAIKGSLTLESDRVLIGDICTVAPILHKPIEWGNVTIRELEALNTPRISTSKPLRILGVAPSGVGLTTLIRQAAEISGSGFTEDGRDRRTKTYDHYFSVGEKEVTVTELGVNASGLKGLQKMLMMIGGGDRRAAGGGGSSIDAVLFVVSVDEYDQFTESGENKLQAAAKMFGTVQRSLEAGLPTLVVFNMIDKFHKKAEETDVKGMLEAINADYNSSLEPLDYFKLMFTKAVTSKGKIVFTEANALDKDSAAAVFALATSM